MNNTKNIFGIFAALRSVTANLLTTIMATIGQCARYNLHFGHRKDGLSRWLNIKKRSFYYNTPP